MSKKTEKGNNENEDKNEKRSSIHTTISKKTSQILDKFVNLKDDDNKIFKSKSQIIEEAIDLLNRQYKPKKDDYQTIWNRAREELNMILVGKKTFLSYISGDYKRAFKENIAIDIIEWYKRKSIHDMALDELLESIKNIWISANYFYKVDIEVGSKGTYQMLFYHDFHSNDYSEFWGGYFSRLLSHQKECDVEIFARNESLLLIITPPNI